MGFTNCSYLEVIRKGPMMANSKKVNNMKKISALILFFVLSVTSSALCNAKDVGQCMGDCASDQGICISRCDGDGQCIGDCASDHGTCVSRCNQ